MYSNLDMQCLISKGIIHNYMNEVIKNETNDEKKQNMTNVIKDFKDDLARAESFLRFIKPLFNDNSLSFRYDLVQEGEKYTDNLKSYIEILRELK